MKTRFLSTVILSTLGFVGTSLVPIDVRVDDDGGSFSALVQPLRLLHRQAVAQESGAEFGPSNVFQLVSNVQSEIEILREAMGITDYPVEAEPENDRSPIHVFSRTLELRRKIAAAQRRLGMNPGSIEQMPVKVIEPRDVFASVQIALAELRRVKEQLVIEDAIELAPLSEARPLPWSISTWETRRS